MTLRMSLQVGDLKGPVSSAVLTYQVGAAPEVRLSLLGGGGGDRLVGAEGVLGWEDGSVPVLILGSEMLPGARGIEVHGVAIGRATRERLGRQMEATGGRTLVLQRRRDQSTAAWLHAATGGLVRDKDLEALAVNAEAAFPSLSIFARCPHHSALQSASAVLSAVNARWRLTEDPSGQPLRATPTGLRRPFPSRVTPGGSHEGPSGTGTFHLDASLAREPKGFWTGLLVGGIWPAEEIAEPWPATWKGLDVDVRRVEVLAAADRPIRVRHTVQLAQFRGEQAPYIRNSCTVTAMIGGWVDGPTGLISVRPAAGWAVMSADGANISEDPLVATLLMPAFGQGDDRVGLYVPPQAADCRVLLVDGALPVTLGSPQVQTEIGAASAVLGKSVALAGVITAAHDAVHVHTKMTVKGDIQLEA
jgi:hypothetical protein